MNQLNLKIKNYNPLNIVVLIDNQTIKPEKNKSSGTNYAYQTEKDKIKISIYSVSEYASKSWILMFLLYTFITILGIFDIREKYPYRTLVFDMDTCLTENTQISLCYNKYANNQKGLEIESNTNYVENNNIYADDETLKKRHKATKLIKKLIWIVAIIFAIAILIISSI